MGRAFIITISIIGAAFVAAAAVPAGAQSYTEDPAYTVQQEQMSPRALDALLAPIALYPDQLLAQVLMAATYPHDVEEAAEWTSHASNASLRGDALTFALEPWEWDASVKTLAQFPDVLRMLDDEYDWTVRVGNAFLLQERDVMDSIQRLRHQARAAGHLRSNEFQRVYFNGAAIVIDMVDPSTVYVPAYDPIRVYGAWIYPDYPPFYFHRPVVVTRYVVVPTLWGWSSWDWHRHRIRVDIPRYRSFNRHRDWRFNDDTWRHDPRRRWNTNFRRDGRWDGDRDRDRHRGDTRWRDNDRRDERRDWNRNDRNDRNDRDGRRDRRADLIPNVTPNAPAEAFRGDPDRNRRQFGGSTGTESRFRGPYQNRQPRAEQGGSSDQQTDDQNRRQRRDRFGGGGERGNRPQRQERQAYAGPQLTPPGPVAPMRPETPRANREERRRDFQAAGAFRGDPDRNRRQPGGNGGVRRGGDRSHDGGGQGRGRGRGNGDGNGRRGGGEGR